MRELRYQQALELFGGMAQRDAQRATESCASQLLSHGHCAERATVFLHGMSASPRQFSALARRAFEGGDNVLVPRLPKHGYLDRMSSALRDLRSDHLITCAEQSLRIAGGLGKDVRVLGFSLGGLLAAWIAQHHSVERAIAIAPLLGILGVPACATPALVKALRVMPNRLVWWHPIKRETLMPAHGYPQFATHAIGEALALAVDLLKAARTSAPRSPIVLVTNSGECAVSNAAVRRLAAAWDLHGTTSVEKRRIRGLGVSHDIIEPLRTRNKSYPLLFELLDT